MLLVIFPKYGKCLFSPRDENLGIQWTLMKRGLHVLENICICCKNPINKSKASKTKMQKEFNCKLMNLHSFICLLKYLTKPL